MWRVASSNGWRMYQHQQRINNAESAYRGLIVWRREAEAMAYHVAWRQSWRVRNRMVVWRSERGVCESLWRNSINVNQYGVTRR